MCMCIIHTTDCRPDLGLIEALTKPNAKAPSSKARVGAASSLSDSGSGAAAGGSGGGAGGAEAATTEVGNGSTYLNLAARLLTFNSPSPPLTPNLHDTARQAAAGAATATVDVQATRALHDARLLGIPVEFTATPSGDAYGLWFAEDNVQVRPAGFH